MIDFLFFGWKNSVHLVELKGTGELYAMKAMEKAMMLNRNKVYDGEWVSFREGKLNNSPFILFLSLTTCSFMQAHRACIEREIISLLDHPLLPTLYASFQVDVLILFASCQFFCFMAEVFFSFRRHLHTFVWLQTSAQVESCLHCLTDNLWKYWQRTLQGTLFSSVYKYNGVTEYLMVMFWLNIGTMLENISSSINHSVNSYSDNW